MSTLVGAVINSGIYSSAQSALSLPLSASGGIPGPTVPFAQSGLAAIVTPKLTADAKKLADAAAKNRRALPRADGGGADRKTAPPGVTRGGGFPDVLNWQYYAIGGVAVLVACALYTRMR